MPPPRSALSNCHIVLGVSLLWSHTDRGMWLTPGADISLLIGQLLTMPGCDWSGCWHTNMTHSGVRVTVIGRGHTGKNILLFFKLAGARFLKYFICYSTLKYLICYASSFSNFTCCERSVEVCGEVSNWYLTDSKWHNESKQRIEWFSDSGPWPRHNCVQFNYLNECYWPQHAMPQPIRGQCPGPGDQWEASHPMSGHDPGARRLTDNVLTVFVSGGAAGRGEGQSSPLNYHD